MRGRFYFLGVIRGLYINIRALWVHQNGLVKDAMDRLVQYLTNTSANSTNVNGDDDGCDVEEAQIHLK